MLSENARKKTTVQKTSIMTSH